MHDPSPHKDRRTKTNVAFGFPYLFLQCVCAECELNM